MLIKRSDTPGARPHLSPGELAHNLPDQTFFMRADGRVVEIDLPAISAGLPPPEGMRGAVLSRTATGKAWDPELAALAVDAQGAVRVDRPPQGLGVPGFHPTTQTSIAAMPAETLLAEPFNVASDFIDLKAMATRLLDGAGAVRIGVMRANGEVLVDRLIPAPAFDAPVRQSVSMRLPRGRYFAFLWSETDAQARLIHGHRLNQGFDAHGVSDALRFVVRRQASGAFIDGVQMSALLTPIRPILSGQPGDRRAVLMDWSV